MKTMSLDSFSSVVDNFQMFYLRCPCGSHSFNAKANAREGDLGKQIEILACRNCGSEFRFTMETFILKKKAQEEIFCPDCEKDSEIFCKRDVDVICRICGDSFCGAHIGPHLENVHCVSLNNDHCTKQKE